MNVDNVKLQMRRGMLEYCILSPLEKQSAYTSDIIQWPRGAKLLAVGGALYSLLTWLKNNHLLSHKWQESMQGPPRKYHMSTEKGAAFPRELDKARGEIATIVNYLKQPK